ncbi:MAG: Gfo/Idh/MocA family protein [Eubacteriales bacterium]
MKKVAILGTENSHAWAFAELIRSGTVKNLSLVGAYGYEEEANAKMLKLGTPRIAQYPDEFVDEIDAVIITARHGDHHYEYAMPYLRRGIPTFIDKPFCIKEENAEEMVKTAMDSGSLLCGGSCLALDDGVIELRDAIENGGQTLGTICGGSVSAPVSLENEYGGFFFYAQHLIQMMTTIFGISVRSVLASQEGKHITVICRYDGFDVTNHFYESYKYTAVVYGTKEVLQRECGLDISGLYRRELDEFREMLDSGTMPHSYKTLAAPVYILNAIHSSVKDGQWHAVSYPEL